jgi:hypothetical protein
MHTTVMWASEQATVHIAQGRSGEGFGMIPQIPELKV